jgi:hypothetical protein
VSGFFPGHFPFPYKGREMSLEENQGHARAEPPLNWAKGESLFQARMLSQIQLTETGERGLLTPKDKEGGFRGFHEFRA